MLAGCSSSWGAHTLRVLPAILATVNQGTAVYNRRLPSGLSLEFRVLQPTETVHDDKGLTTNGPQDESARR